MNPLEALKQKLKVKPIVEEKERVAVIIKGDKQKTARPKKNKEPTNKRDEQELLEFVPEIEGLEENVDIVKKPVVGITGPLIVDKTEQGYDRMALLQKLKESKMTKVFVKPLIEEVEEKQIVQPVIVPPKKRAKKVNLPLRIEEGEEEENDVEKRNQNIL